MRDVYPNPNVGANIKGGFDVLVVTKDGGQKSSDSQYVLDILLCLAWFGSYQNNIATCQTKKNKAVHNNNYYESGNNWDRSSWKSLQIFTSSFA